MLASTGDTFALSWYDFPRFGHDSPSVRDVSAQVWDGFACFWGDFAIDWDYFPCQGDDFLIFEDDLIMVGMILLASGITLPALGCDSACFRDDFTSVLGYFDPSTDLLCLAWLTSIMAQSCYGNNCYKPFS